MTMWKTGLFFVVACTIVHGCIYKDRECADYTVEERHDDYEIRLYPALTWVTTSEENHFWRVAQSKAFLKLFNYIDGKNDRGIKINMTVPVKMRYTQNGESQVYKMSFMVPSELAANPPSPNDKEITVSYEGPVKYAVRQFSGYVLRQKKWEEEANRLANSVSGDDTVDTTKYYQVGYDAPFELINRRNEVWMLKKTREEANEV